VTAAATATIRFRRGASRRYRPVRREIQLKGIQEHETEFAVLCFPCSHRMWARWRLTSSARPMAVAASLSSSRGTGCPPSPNVTRNFGSALLPILGRAQSGQRLRLRLAVNPPFQLFGATAERFELPLETGDDLGFGGVSLVGWVKVSDICWRRSKLARMSRISAVDWSASSLGL
jgi:hypothetical protein